MAQVVYPSEENTRSDWTGFDDTHNPSFDNFSPGTQFDTDVRDASDAIGSNAVLDNILSHVKTLAAQDPRVLSAASQLSLSSFSNSISDFNHRPRSPPFLPFPSDINSPSPLGKRKESASPTPSPPGLRSESSPRKYQRTLSDKKAAPRPPETELEKIGSRSLEDDSLMEIDDLSPVRRTRSGAAEQQEAIPQKFARRRAPGELAEHERWNCPWGCGKFYRLTSTESVRKHTNTCSQRPSTEDELKQRLEQNQSKLGKQGGEPQKLEPLPGNPRTLKAFRNMNRFRCSTSHRVFIQACVRNSHSFRPNGFNADAEKRQSWRRTRSGFVQTRAVTSFTSAPPLRQSQSTCQHAVTILKTKTKQEAATGNSIGLVTNRVESLQWM
jgi:hypothetical protein